MLFSSSFDEKLQQSMSLFSCYQKNCKMMDVSDPSMDAVSSSSRRMNLESSLVKIGREGGVVSSPVETEKDMVLYLTDKEISYSSSDKEEEELLLREPKHRYNLFPVEYHDIWMAYKNHQRAFWTAEEIDFGADREDWNRLEEKERLFIEYVLAFFASSDGIVLENLLQNFCSEIAIPEVRCFYAFQAMMENVHSEVYNLLIETYIGDPDRKRFLMDAIHQIPCIERKAQWAIQWIQSNRNAPGSLGRRLFAFGIVEGLFFSGSFCAIFWLKEKGVMTKALGKSNEWIARDESLHTQFAIMLYTQYIQNKISEVEAHQIIHQAVLIEEEFICESLPVKLIGMDQARMREYIRFCADRLLFQFGYRKLYYESNPFPFMEKISMEGKTNFFEQRVTEYSLPPSMDSQSIFQFDTHF